MDKVELKRKGIVIQRESTLHEKGAIAVQNYDEARNKEYKELYEKEAMRLKRDLRYTDE